MADYSLAGEGVIWIQPDGPNTEPKVLGCHMIDGIDEPQGDVTIFYCPDPKIPNKFNVKGSFQGEPGAVTFTVETDLLKTADYLEEISCPVPMYIGKVSCGRKNVFGAYDRMFVMERSRITKKGLTKMVASDPGSQDRTKQTFDVSVETMVREFQRKGIREAIAETEALNSITNCSDDQCAGDCGDSSKAGDNLYTGGDTLAGSPLNTADVWSTPDAGATWSLEPTDPFAGGEIIATIQCLVIDRTTTRIIVGRGTTDPANHAEIAYSDDGGHTWTLVDVNTKDGTYFTGPESIFVFDFYNVWAVTTGGYISKSSDGGASWVEQSTGNITAQNLNAVHFADTLYGFAVGAANTILKTEDGGSLWFACVGNATQAADAILTVHTFSQYRVFIGYNDGELYYSHTGGETAVSWFRRTHPMSGAGQIRSMSWFDEYIGAFVHNTAAPVGSVYWTVNGGYTWEVVPLSETNVGLNQIIVVDANLAFAVGEPSGGTAVVYKITK